MFLSYQYLLKFVSALVTILIRELLLYLRRLESHPLKPRSKHSMATQRWLHAWARVRERDEEGERVVNNFDATPWGHRPRAAFPARQYDRSLIMLFRFGYVQNTHIELYHIHPIGLYFFFHFIVALSHLSINAVLSLIFYKFINPWQHSLKKRLNTHVYTYRVHHSNYSRVFTILFYYNAIYFVYFTTAFYFNTWEAWRHHTVYSAGYRQPSRRQSSRAERGSIAE